MARPFTIVAAISLLFGVSCSSFKRDKNYVNIEFERGWSRDTVSTDYLGYRHPAMVTPVLSKDIIVTGNGTDAVAAFSRKSGHLLWKKNIKNGTEGIFFDNEGGVFFGGNDGRFYSVDIQTGKLDWNYPLNSESTVAPTVQGKFIFHMAMNGTLYALEKESGRVLWVKAKSLKSTLTVRGSAQPIFSDGKIYAGHSDGMFTAYNAADGAVLWEKQLSDKSKFNDIDARPLVAGDCILVATYSESLFCLDKQTGQTRWTLSDGGSARPIYVEGQDVYYTTDAAIMIVDLKSGKVRKSHKVKSDVGIPTGAVPYKSWVVVGFSEGPLVLMDKETGEWVDTFYPGRGVSATPALDGATGEVFLVSNQANIYKLNIKSGVVR
ncbi:MAG: PQQ-binding-like beta-propeller repeat protein [Bdellovibrionaceae bacterium]|nr:PQQ-binding-like beta-propeller repeat protein [Pseudobdellovibrionaceae bacterium]